MCFLLGMLEAVSSQMSWKLSLETKKKLLSLLRTVGELIRGGKNLERGLSPNGSGKSSKIKYCREVQRGFYKVFTS